MSRFAGRSVLVAGGGSVGPGWGNGKAAAVLYAREGARVLVVDRNPEAAAETAGIIADEGGRAEPFAADLTDPAAVEAAVAAMQVWGGPDVMHFNIGISVRGGVVAHDPADWDRVFAANLSSAFLTARAVLPGMEARGRGALVFIASLAATRKGPFAYTAYEASKAALCRMAQSIAGEYAIKGIRSNVVLPGLIATPHVNAFVRPDVDPGEFAALRAALSPTGRQGTAWDVARAAAFLASDDAAYINGVLLPVDGGLGL